MYLVLVTNKGSNILEDLETLRLLGKVVADFVMPMEEDMVSEVAFDLIFAFDEVVTSGGFKENVTSAQVRQNTEMESHEEKLHKMIIQSKINETKDIMKKKAMEIERSKLEAARSGSGGRGFGGGSGFGGAGAGGGSGSGPSMSYARPEPSPVMLGTSRVGGGAGEERSHQAGGIRKGMQLGKSKLGRKDILESLKAEGEVVEDVSSAAVAAAPVRPTPTEPVFLEIEEKMSVALNKDGGLEGMEVSGTMSLIVTRESDACLRVLLRETPTEGYQFKTHPNIDKTLYGSENALGLKDPARPFPVGSPLGILKWRMQTVDESYVPLTINCWPSISGGRSYVNIEYESTRPDLDLHDVQIIVPVPAGAGPPSVNQIDGQWRFDSKTSAWIWTIDLVDSSNASGAAEFVVPAANAEAFFPVSVSFSCPRTLCDLSIAEVVDATTGQPIKYGTSSTLTTESYVVE